MSEQINNDRKFELFSKSNVYNATKQVQGLIKKDILNISNDNFSNLLKVKPREFNYLKISNPKNKNWRPITIKNKTPFSLYLGKLKEEFIEIDIVYFINTIISPQYKYLFRDQLKQLLKSKLLIQTKSKLHIVCIRNRKKEENTIRDILISLDLNKYSEIDLIFKNDEHMEYEGIKKVWDLSKLNKNRLIIYFHAKGLSYMKNKFFYIRQPLEKFIFGLLINEWKKNLEILLRFNSVKKIGILSGGKTFGFLWFNFWIAESSYIRGLEKPLKTKRACYYEDWLGRYLVDNSAEYKSVDIEKNYNNIYLYKINQTVSILNNPKKDKYNIGTICKVERGGFVGLGLVRYTYKIWYLFYKYLNRIFN